MCVCVCVCVFVCMLNFVVLLTVCMHNIYICICFFFPNPCTLNKHMNHVMTVINVNVCLARLGVEGLGQIPAIRRPV